MENIKYVNVIGAGLAGCECAWILAKNGIKVKLYEMKPIKKQRHIKVIILQNLCVVIL